MEKPTIVASVLKADKTAYLFLFPTYFTNKKIVREGI